MASFVNLSFFIHNSYLRASLRSASLSAAAILASSWATLSASLLAASANLSTSLAASWAFLSVSLLKASAA